MLRTVVVFVLTAGLCGAGVWIPTQSRDEAATVSAVSRSWSKLFEMLGHVDVVHGLFYAAMKVWLGEAGVSTLTLRLPSVLACALAAGLVVVLGSVLVSRRAGLAAGLVCAVSPRITRIAVEGRSAAWFTAVAVLLVLLVVLAVRRPSRWWALPIAVTTTVLGFLHLYATLLVPVLLVYLVVAPLGPHLRQPSSQDPGRQEPGSTDPAAGGARRDRLREFREVRAGWALLGLLVGCGPVAWLALRARTQQTQVDWIDPPSLQTLAGVGSETVSPRNSRWGLVAWTAAIVRLPWLGRHRARPGTRGTSLLLVGWVAGPPLALLLVSSVWTPLYSHRYMAFCAPALALLAGTGIALIRRPAVSVTVAVAVVLTSLFTYREQRLVDAWDSWQEIMDVLAHDGQPGDALIDYPLPSGIEVSYPDALQGFRIINAGQDRVSADSLWDQRLPLAQIEPRLAGVRRLWYLTPTDNDVVRTAEIARLRRLGFDGQMLERGPSEQTWLFTRTHTDAVEGDRLLTRRG